MPAQLDDVIRPVSSHYEERRNRINRPAGLLTGRRSQKQDPSTAQYHWHMSDSECMLFLYVKSQIRITDFLFSAHNTNVILLITV